MNLGINDAANLGWKLAYDVAGRAPDTLLDSYGAERRPAAQQVMAFTDNMVRFVLETSPFKRTLRRAMMPLLRMPRTRRRMANRMAQLVIAYPDSPITQPGRVRGLPEPGARMPNIRLYDGRTMNEALREGEHVLAGPDDGLPGRPSGATVTARRSTSTGLISATCGCVSRCAGSRRNDARPTDSKAMRQGHGADPGHGRTRCGPSIGDWRGRMRSADETK